MLSRLLISTAVLVVAMLVLQMLTARFIRRNVQSVEHRRRWLVQSRNAFMLLLILGLVMVWGEELRTLALSVVAIAVAIVVATKELILCVSGSVLKMASRSFSIGDRIQIKDFRGDVIDHNLLATTILEVGPGRLTHQRTGRMTVIPNALFVSEPVVNESYTHDHILHVFTVPFKREEDWRTAQAALLQSARRHCAPYVEDVRRHMDQVSGQRGLEAPNVEPRVTIQVPTASEVNLVVRIPARSAQRSHLEQAIITDVLGAATAKAETADHSDSEPV